MKRLKNSIGFKSTNNISNVLVESKSRNILPNKSDNSIENKSKNETKDKNYKITNNENSNKENIFIHNNNNNNNINLNNKSKSFNRKKQSESKYTTPKFTQEQNESKERSSINTIKRLITITDENKENTSNIVNVCTIRTLNYNNNNIINNNNEKSIDNIIKLPTVNNTNCNSEENNNINETRDLYHLVHNINPQTTVEYIDDIKKVLIQTEKINLPNPYYIHNINNITINMRSILVDWIIGVHYKFYLKPETLFLTINIIDRYLDTDKNILKDDLQLLGLTSLVIACKYEEIYFPDPKDFLQKTIGVGEKCYSIQDLLQMEICILKNLKYELLTASPYQFLTIIIQFLNENDKEDKEVKKDEDKNEDKDTYNNYNKDLIQRTTNLAMYILELTLIEYKMLKYPCSVKACSAVYISRKLLKCKYAWSADLKSVFPVRDGVIRSCAKEITDLINIANKKDYKNCKRKYSSEQYLNVRSIVQNFE